MAKFGSLKLKIFSCNIDNSDENGKAKLKKEHKNLTLKITKII